MDSSFLGPVGPRAADLGSIMARELERVNVLEREMARQNWLQNHRQWPKIDVSKLVAGPPSGIISHQIDPTAILAGPVVDINCTSAMERSIQASAIQAGPKPMAESITISAARVQEELERLPAAMRSVRLVYSEPDTLPAPKPATKPATVETLIARAEETAYAEIYAVFRHREKVDGDRLPDCLLTTDTLEEAVTMLIRLAGFDQMEAEELGLDKFDTSDLDALYSRLQELTGDTYEISPYEQPTLP